MSDIRILLLADSHLGFDLPLQPRVVRRRRGDDFLANYRAALAPALRGEVDLVVHAGDVFDRSRPAPATAWLALEPLRRIAELGVPVFVVPGNHERSRLPHARFATHPLVHVFDRPRTFAVRVRGETIALSGFPYEHEVRRAFPSVLEATAWRAHDASLRLLCMHQCAEGASVGPVNYTFTTAADVVRHADIPSDFAAVLSGHIHRHQVLTRDLTGRPLHTPVIYPGSIERTATAEIGERKGFIILEAESGASPRMRWEFRELPARPMSRHELSADGLSDVQLASAVRRLLRTEPADAVVSIRVSGVSTAAQSRAISTARIRARAPATMNVELAVAGDRPSRTVPTSKSEEGQFRLAV